MDLLKNPLILMANLRADGEKETPPIVLLGSYEKFFITNIMNLLNKSYENLLQY